MDTGAGWQTIAEVDVIDGRVTPPTAWTAARVLRKQIKYTGDLSEQIMRPRDTQFVGFAKLLVEELLQADTSEIHTGDDGTLSRTWETLIARRAYDLVTHAVLSIGPADLDRLTTDECVQSVPDLAKLPVVEGGRRESEGSDEK